MTQTTKTARIPVTTGYVEIFMSSASGGFGEYQRQGGGDDFFESAEDLLAEAGASAWLSNDEDLDGQDADEDGELAEAIEEYAGVTHNEPDILVALREEDGIRVIGIDRVDCYELASGELVPVDAYDPGRHTLA